MNPNIKSTRQLGQINGCKILVYAGSGAGKTRLCASAPKPLIISAEKGLLSLSSLDVAAWEIKSFGDLVEVFKYLNTNEGKQWQTICLDSASEIAETLYAELDRKMNDPRKLYPKLQSQLTSAFRDFRDLPGRNIVMLAKQEIVVDAMGGQSFRPMFPGKQLAQQAPYFFDEVFFLKTGVTQSGQRWYGLQTQPSATHVAKDRSGKLLELENADPYTGGGLTYIFNKMIS